jgi:oxygen-independent coproporphyrinogen-3 oxidase
MMNALRLNDGFEIDTFTSRCNLSQQTIQPLLDKHQSAGLIKIEPNRIRPTRFGHNMLNNMLEDYLSLGE